MQQVRKLTTGLLLRWLDEDDWSQIWFLVLGSPLQRWSCWDTLHDPVLARYVKTHVQRASAELALRPLGEDRMDHLNALDHLNRLVPLLILVLRSPRVDVSTAQAGWLEYLL